MLYYKSNRGNNPLTSIQRTYSLDLQDVTTGDVTTVSTTAASAWDAHQFARVNFANATVIAIRVA